MYTSPPPIYTYSHTFARHVVLPISLPVVPLLVGFLSFLALSQQLEDVGQRGFTTGSALTVVVLTLPRQLLDILPVVALLGCLTGLGAMANHRELTAARAAEIGRAHV